MKTITFVTGNLGKVKKLEEYLGLHFDHAAVDLDELQELDLGKVVEHKARQAYAILQRPVIVEDTSLEFQALNRLPGTFVKHFISELGLQKLANLAPSENRCATARTAFAYSDGERLEIIQGQITGLIAEAPAGSNGFGWDAIFIPDGLTKTRSQLSEADYEASYTLQKNFDGLRKFLSDMGFTPSPPLGEQKRP